MPRRDRGTESATKGMSAAHTRAQNLCLSHGEKRPLLVQNTFNLRQARHESIVSLLWNVGGRDENLRLTPGHLRRRESVVQPATGGGSLRPRWPVLRFVRLSRARCRRIDVKGLTEYERKVDPAPAVHEATGVRCSSDSGVRH